MRRRSQRPGPLEPILKYDPRRGSIAVGNTPGISPNGVLYTAMLAAGPLAMWNFTEDSGTFADVTGNGNDTQSPTGFTYDDWTSPDAWTRASVSAGKVAALAVDAAIYDGLTSGGLTFIVALEPTTAGDNFFFEIDGATNQTYYQISYQTSSHFYVRIGRTTGGAYRLWRIAKTTTEMAAARLIYVHQPDVDTAPTVRVNGSVWSLTSFSGPSGTPDTRSGDLWVVGGENNSAYGNLGPRAIYAGQESPTAIEAAAVSEGWY